MDLRTLQNDINAYLSAVRVETDGPPKPFVSVCGKGNDESDVLQDDQAIENARELGRLVARALAPNE